MHVWYVKANSTFYICKINSDEHATVVSCTRIYIRVYVVVVTITYTYGSITEVITCKRFRNI